MNRQLICLLALVTTVCVTTPAVLASDRVLFPEEQPVVPAYARFTTVSDLGFTDREWFVIPFYRDPACVPRNFNLLEFFDRPRAWQCDEDIPPYIEGFVIRSQPAPAPPEVFHADGLDGMPIWFVGFAVETIADGQKRRYRDEHGSDGFIATGLWRYSRHPNYLGEIILWFGVALLALPALSGWQWVTLVSPVFVFLLLTRVSGVPLLERKADKRWGENPAYIAYRDSTPVLVPFFGRRGAA